MLAGELAEAERLIEEERLIAEATGSPPVRNAAMWLAAWRGREQEASELIRATVQGATESGAGRMVGFAAYASAVLDNGLGRYDAAQTPPGRYSSANIWGSATWSWLSWPRRRPGPVTSRPSGRRWTGCPSAPG